MSEEIVDPETGYFVKQADPELERLLAEEAQFEKDRAEHVRREEVHTNLRMALAPYATEATEMGNDEVLEAIAILLRYARYVG